MKSINIDEEGFFASGGLRWDDPAVGLDLLQSLQRAENGAYITKVKGEDIWVEAFDHPIVAVDVRPYSDSVWILTGRYGFEARFDLKTLSLDNWDRFHGQTEQNISFILSRNAQYRFFDQLDEFHDESFVWNKKTYNVQPWPLRKIAEPPASLNDPHPSLPTILIQLKLTKSRILVLGVGNKPNAEFLRQAGHLVHEQENIFELSQSQQNHFDIIFDHAYYCSVDPSLRNKLVTTYRKALHDQGQLLGIFPLYDRDSGPPFSSTEWEIREQFKKDFQYLYWTRSRLTSPERFGQELIVLARKVE